MRSDPRLTAVETSPAGDPPRHALQANCTEWPLNEVAVERPFSPINYRVLIVSLIGGSLLCFGVRCLHDWQINRLADQFREWGIEARNRGDAEAAISHLQRYLSVGARDVDAIASLAFSIEETADDPASRYEALQLFEGILRERPLSTDVRRKLVDLHIEFGRYADAVQHIDVLLLRSPHDAELLRLSGENLERLGRYQVAVQAYRRAIEAAPRELTNYRRLVGLYAHRLEVMEQAEELLNDLVRRNPQNPEGYVMRAQFALDHGLIRQARIDAIRAYRLAPQSVDVCTLMVSLVAQGPWPTNPVSQGKLRAILDAVDFNDENDELETDVALALVQLDVFDGNYEQAGMRLQSILQTAPDSEIANCLQADVLMLQGDIDAAGASVTKLESRFGDHWYLSEFLRARMAFQASEWPAAVKLFRQVMLNPSAPLALRCRAGLRIADCWEEMGHLIHRHQTFLDVLSLNPDLADAIVRLAESHLMMGQFDEAIKQYKRLEDDPAALAAIAQAMIAKHRQLPENKQRWEIVEKAIDRATTADPNSVTGALLRSQLLLAQQRPDEAEEVLQRAAKRRPGDRQLWLLLTAVRATQGGWSAATETLEQFDLNSAGSGTTIGKRIELAAAAGDRDQLQQYQDGLSTLAGEQRLTALRSLAAGWSGVGNLDQADKCWSEIETQRPFDLSVMRAKFMIALRQGDEQAAHALISKMREVEGRTGIYWQLAEATRLYALGRQGQRDRLADARRILESLEGRFLDSTKVRTLLGDICQLEGDLERALEHYSAVVDEGTPSQHCVLQLAKLMYQRGEFAEVGRLIRRFEQANSLNIGSQLAQVGTLASLQESELGEAVRFAEASHGSAEETLDGQIWLGQVYQLAGRSEQAEVHFRNATKIAPEQPAGWIALAAFLHASNRADDLTAAIEEAKESVSDQLVNMTLAQCYDVTGEAEKSAAYYNRELADGVQNAWELVQGVRFSVRSGRREQATKILRDLIDSPHPENPSLVVLARRTLAGLLAESGGYSARQEALALLNENPLVPDSQSDQHDLRLQTRLLASSPLRADQRAAVHFYDELKSRRPLSVQDTMVLAQLYAALDDIESAQREARHLVARSPRDSRILTFAMSLLLKTDGNEELLADLIDRLQGMRPEEIDTVALSAQWLIRKGQIEEALALLSESALSEQSDLNEDQTRQRLLRLAVAVDEIAKDLDRTGRLTSAEDFAVLAEQLYDRSADGDPASRIQLVRFFLRWWRIDDALQTCERLREVVSDERLARVYVQVLRTQQVGPDDAEDVRLWIQSRCSAQPDSSTLRLSYAHALALGGDYEAALESYQFVLERDPKNVEALNEAAILQVLTNGDANEAASLIDRAIQQVGPVGVLVDTRAAVELALGAPEAAILSAETAIAESPSSVRHFRLSQAHFASGNASQARDALQTAFKFGLHTNSLHPLEVSAFRQLRSDLKL